MNATKTTTWADVASTDQYSNIANSDVVVDRGPDAAHIETMTPYVRDVSDERRFVAQMREALPGFLRTRENKQDIATVLSTYDPVRAMSTLVNAAEMRAFHPTLEALLPGSRSLADAGDLTHPDRVLDRVAHALYDWAARDRPLSGPEYTQ